MNSLIKRLFDALIAYIRSFLAALAIDTGRVDMFVKILSIKRHTIDYLKRVVKKYSFDESVAGKVIAITAFVLLLLLYLGSEPVVPTVKALSFLGVIDILTSGAAGNKEKFSVQNVKYSFSPL